MDLEQFSLPEPAVGMIASDSFGPINSLSKRFIDNKQKKTTHVGPMEVR